MRINVGAAVQVSPRLSAVLEGLLDPLVEDRLGAQEALDILTGTEASLAGCALPVSMPSTFLLWANLLFTHHEQPPPAN